MKCVYWYFVFGYIETQWPPLGSETYTFIEGSVVDLYLGLSKVEGVLTSDIH